MGQLKNIFLSIGIVFGFLAYSPEALGQSTQFLRGDANSDGDLDLSDSIKTIFYLFLGGGASCLDALDSNDSGELDLSDILYSLSYLYLRGPEPPPPGMSCGEDPTQDSLGCESYSPCIPNELRQSGQSEFSTPIAGNVYSLDPTLAVDGENRDGAPANPTPQAPPAEENSQEPDREIEEADLYKVVGNHIFVLNRYRGLYIISLEDLENPKVIGRAPIFGHPIEMYVREDKKQAYVLVSDYYTYWRDPGALEMDAYPRRFYGSQVRILDFTDMTDPQVVGGINLEGYLSDSRIVGDVMYVVSQRYSWYYRQYSDDTVDKTVIHSIDIHDPANVDVVASKDFPRQGWDHHIHVTQNAIYLASTGYDRDVREYRSTIHYIDITDPLGSIQLRGVANARGRIMDRWSMDEYKNVLRVASTQSWGNGDVYLTTYSLENPDEIELLGLYILNVQERLTSARFDGDRGYLVTYRMIDPLFSFDLSKPEKPVLLGELEMTGWLDFMVPMGNRLVALGHEDTEENGTMIRSLAVSLIDVEEKPKLLSRVTVGENWGWVPGDRDDFAKVFKTLPDLNLVLFPFQSWSRTDYRYIGGVQLIDLLLDEDRLVKRGLIGNSGWVERGISYNENTVLTIAMTNFQVVDIEDRDNPKILGKLQLARNVQDFALLGDDHTVQLAGDWWLGDTTLLTTPIEDPNTPTPVGEVHIPAPYGSMFTNGSLAYITSVQEVPPEPDSNEAPKSATHIQVVDLSDPENPVERGSMILPEVIWSYHGWYWGWGDEVVQVNGSTLVFHRYQYYWWYMDCFDCAVAGPWIPPEPPEHKVYVADLSDPDNPQLAATITLNERDWAWGLKASGTMVYISAYRTVEEEKGWAARYYLHRFDVADPENPVEYPAVNIPGFFVDATPDGKIIYTSENYWDRDYEKSYYLFHALELKEDQAVLLSTVELPGYANGFEVEDGAAFTVTRFWGYRIIDETTGSREYFREDHLVTIDLSNPQEIFIAAKVALSQLDYAYLQKVENGLAFLGHWTGLMVYDVSDITLPAFKEFFRTQGWTQDIVLRGDQVFVTSGYYGVQVLDLGTGGAP